MPWLLALIIFLLPGYLIRFSVFGLPTTILEVAIYIGFLWLLISQPIAYSFERIVKLSRSYALPIALIFLGALIGTLIAPDKQIALGLFKAYILDPLLLFLTIIGSLKDRSQVKVVAYSLMASGFLVGLTALFGPSNTEGRALGLYALDPSASPNFLALFLAPIASFTLGYLCFSQYWKEQTLFALAYLVMALGVLQSGSRGGILAITFGGLLVIVWRLAIAQSTKNQRRLQLIGLVLGMILLAAGFLSGKPNFTGTAGVRETTSNNLRYEIWRTTVVDIIPKTFIQGTGLGNYQSYFSSITKERINFPEYIAPWARTPHNFFLTIWTNLGFLGLIGFLILLYQIIRQNIAKLSSLSVGLLAATTSLVIHGLVDASYWKNDLAALFWVILALSVINYSDRAQKQKGMS